MRRWNIRAALTVACIRPTRHLRHAAVPFIRSVSTTTATERESHQIPPATRFRRNAIFDKIQRPERSVGAWTALLDGALPPHLRDWSNGTSPPTLSAVDVAEILHEAQYPHDSSEAPFDPLYHLGFNQGRWNAVVWLVKKLVQKFPVRHARNSRLSKVNSIWDQPTTLENLTLLPLELPTSAHVPNTGVLELRSLDDLTTVTENCSREDVIGLEALGHIWRTLGNMTKACAGQDIRPEVLEIIAFLHHEEVMPMSIYQSERHLDSSAIQQPPLLSLMSSRILTSLSDAAWRAHEKLVVEEAKAMGGEYAALRPEIPGTVYRVRVAGLRPEVWMELILWSCLRGGWLLPGADILQSICEDPDWRPLSWKDYEQALPPEEYTNSTSWTDMEYQFNTRGLSTRDAPKGPQPLIKQTVSAELVNAYIDALAGTVDVGVGNRVVGIDEVISKLQRLKVFLRKRGFRLTLSTGSWDALILRLIESQGGLANLHVAAIRQLVSLSPGFSQGLKASNTQGLPPYVLDGNMAMHGLLHRSLDQQIREGSFAGALEIYHQLQNRTDFGRRKSLQDFMGRYRHSSPSRKEHRERAPSRALEANEMFTSNFSGIEYPELDLNIPTATLARFLELATDAKAYEFGRYLLHRNEVDGPVIPESLFDDQYIQPAVIRFAVEANDESLLSTLKAKDFLRGSYRAVFDHQVNALKWESAGRILQQLADVPGYKWSVGNLANLSKSILILKPKASSGDAVAKRELHAATSLFKDMVEGKHGDWSAPLRRPNPLQTLAAVLIAADGTLVELCTALIPSSAYQTFKLRPRSFNIVLDGVVTAYGSAAGKRLLTTFWPEAARDAPRAIARLDRNRNLHYRKIGKPRAPLERSWHQRIVVRVPGFAIKNEELVIYGSLVPNTETIMIVLRRALDELADHHDESVTCGKSGNSTKEDDTTRDNIKWAVRRLAELPYVEASIVEQLSETLEKAGLYDLVSELPKIVRIAEDDAPAELDEDAEAVEEESE